MIQPIHVYHGPAKQLSQYEWELWRVSALALAKSGNKPWLYADDDALEAVGRNLGKDFVSQAYVGRVRLPEQAPHGINGRVFWAWAKLWAIKDAMGFFPDASIVCCDTDAILLAWPELGNDVWMAHQEPPPLQGAYFPAAPVPDWTYPMHVGWGNGSVIAFSPGRHGTISSWLRVAFDYMKAACEVPPGANVGNFEQMCRVEQAFLTDLCRHLAVSALLSRKPTRQETELAIKQNRIGQTPRWWMDEPCPYPNEEGKLHGMLHLGVHKKAVRESQEVAGRQLQWLRQIEKMLG